MNDFRILTGVFSPSILEHTYVPNLDENAPKGKISWTSKDTNIPITGKPDESTRWVWLDGQSHITSTLTPTPFPERLIHNFEYDQLVTEKHLDPEPSLFESFILATELEQKTFLSFGAGVDIIVTIIFLVIFSLAFFVNVSFFLFIWKEIVGLFVNMEDDL